MRPSAQNFSTAKKEREKKKRKEKEKNKKVQHEKID
jgi:hypothetical protein